MVTQAAERMVYSVYMDANVNPFANAGPVEGFLRLTAEGQWLYKGERVTHPGLLKILNTNYHREESRYVVHLKLPQGTQKVAVEIEDVPYFILAVSVGSKSATVLLNDGTTEPLDPAALRMSAVGGTYLRVKGGEAEARFLRQPELWLADIVDEQDGKLGVRLHGRFYPVRQS